MHRCVTFRGTQPFPSVQPWRTDTIGSTGRENRIGRRVQVHRAASWIPFVLEVVAKPRLARVSRQDSRTRPSLGGRVSGVVRCYGRAAERKHCGRTHLRTEGIGKPRPSPCTTNPPRLMSLTSSLSLSRHRHRRSILSRDFRARDYAPRNLSLEFVTRIDEGRERSVPRE